MSISNRQSTDTNAAGCGKPHTGDIFHSAELDSSRLPREDATHLPAELYTSEQVFQREKELLFFKDWLVVGREDEVAAPGSYRTFELAGERFIVARDRRGRLNAFINSCRHRGAPVASGSGTAHAFVCPYHAWTYDLEGKLVKPLRADQLGNFPTAGCRLPEIQVDTFGGFIFINFDPEARSLAEYLDLDGFREEIGFLHCEDLVTIDNYTFDVDANWKVLMEAAADVYHVEVVHRETFGRVTAGYKPQTSSNLRLTKHGATKRYSSPTFSPGGQVLFGRLPALTDHPGGETFALSFYLRPNFAFFARCDMIQPLTAMPLTASKTRFMTWTCLPREATSDPDFDGKAQLIKDFCRKVNDEDRNLVLAIQAGFSSRYHPRGPVHELEKILHHRTQGYLEAMKGGGDFS